MGQSLLGQLRRAEPLGRLVIDLPGLLAGNGEPGAIGEPGSDHHLGAPAELHGVVVVVVGLLVDLAGPHGER